MGLFSLFTASFQVFFIISFLILIHEIGHASIAYLFKIKVKEIVIYPLGGVSKFYMDLNIHPMKEFLILIAGPLFQILAYWILIYFIPNKILVIRLYHFSILFFNLLPIYPFDGGKLVRLLLEILFPYRLSLEWILIISLFSLCFILFGSKSLLINRVVMLFYLLILILKEYQKINILYEKFLLERYLKKYNFKKCRMIESEKNFYRNRRHLLKIEDKYVLEKDYLAIKYRK